VFSSFYQTNKKLIAASTTQITDIKNLTLLFFYTFLFLNSNAQLPLRPQPVYVHYNPYNSSLFTEMVYKIVADNYGYIWLATDEGLIMYNGKEFTPVDIGRFEDVISIYKTKENQLWLMTYTGRTRAIDLNNHHLINTDSLYGLDKLKLPIIKPYVLAMQWGPKLLLQQRNYEYLCTNVALAAHKSTLVPISPEDFMAHYRLPAFAGGQDIKKELELIFRRKNTGIYLKKNLLIVGNKIFQVNENTGSTLLFDGAAYGITNYIEAATRCRNDLYIGGLYNIGLIKIPGFFNNPGGKHVLEKVLADEQITDIETDYLDNVWASTHNNGIFFFPASESHSLHYDKRSGLYSDGVTMLKKFDTGITLIGYDNRFADFIYHHQCTRFRIPARQYPARVIYAEKNCGQWYMFTAAEVFKSRSQTAGQLPVSFHPVPPLRPTISQGYKNGGLLNHVFYYAGNSGLLFIDSTGHNVAEYTSQHLKKIKSTCILPLAEDKIYVGTIRGVYYNGALLPYLTDDRFNCIQQTDSLILFCTNTGAYAIMQKDIRNNAALRRIATGAVYDIKKDDRYFYVRNCNEELVAIDKVSLQVAEVFSARKYCIPFTMNDFLVDEKYMVFAGNKGLFYIPKAGHRNAPGHTGPTIHLLSSLFGFSPGKNFFECPYNKSFSVSFRLDVMDYSNETIRIMYRVLKDGREQFRQAGINEHTQMNFQPASPGDYVVEYHVSTGTGSPEQIISFRIIVHPLWYQQPWFIIASLLLLAILLAGVLYTIFRRQVIRHQQKLAQKLHIYELEAESFFGQLKPHLIFNLLTPFQSYLLKGQKKEGLIYLNSFSALMRGILTGMRDKYTTLQAELEFALHYNDVQQKRYGNCFTFEISLQNGLVAAHYKIPTLLLQPLLENAIEHGIRKDRDDGVITLHAGIDREENALFIQVTDNGAGLPENFSLKKNHALQIIAERMDLLKTMYGTGSLRITNRPHPTPGVTVILTLPINTDT
jgi:hypothetical protein